MTAIIIQNICFFYSITHTATCKNCFDFEMGSKFDGHKDCIMSNYVYVVNRWETKKAKHCALICWQHEFGENPIVDVPQFEELEINLYFKLTDKFSPTSHTSYVGRQVATSHMYGSVYKQWNQKKTVNFAPPYTFSISVYSTRWLIHNILFDFIILWTWGIEHIVDNETQPDNLFNQFFFIYERHVDCILYIFMHIILFFCF